MDREGPTRYPVEILGLRGRQWWDSGRDDSRDLGYKVDTSGTVVKTGTQRSVVHTHDEGDSTVLKEKGITVLTGLGSVRELKMIDST